MGETSKPNTYTPIGVGKAGDDVPTSAAEAVKEAVPLEAHIMSKCPDAQVCISYFIHTGWNSY